MTKISANGFAEYTHGDVVFAKNFITAYWVGRVLNSLDNRVTAYLEGGTLTSFHLDRQTSMRVIAMAITDRLLQLPDIIKKYSTFVTFACLKRKSELL